MYRNPVLCILTLFLSLTKIAQLILQIAQTHELLATSGLLDPTN